MATNTVVDAIRSVATDTRVFMAMLMGARLESGWNPGAVGDGGNSHGIFQINLPYHPSMTKASAQDPLAASRYMLPRYQAAVGQVSPSLWNADPAMAAATAAFYAERPARMYPTNRIRSAWPVVSGAMSGNVAVGGNTGGTGGVDSLTAAGLPNPIAGAEGLLWEGINFTWDLFGEGFNRVYFAVLMGAGVLLVIAGLLLMWRESGKVQATASATGNALWAPIRGARKVVNREV